VWTNPTLLRRRLDEQFTSLDVDAWARPRDGWIKSIRQALGMSGVELAMRMSISDSRVGRIERAEVEGLLRISTLSRAAAALNCRLVYVLAPSEPLEDMVLRQAYLKAAEELSLPATVASGTTDLDGDVDDYLEGRSLQLVDRSGLWHRRSKWE
jgi:predicted DNA-binding mobile mystery protein A